MDVDDCNDEPNLNQNSYCKGDMNVFPEKTQPILLINNKNVVNLLLNNKFQTNNIDTAKKRIRLQPNEETSKDQNSISVIINGKRYYSKFSIAITLHNCF
jgi:hypothetical protein